MNNNMYGKHGTVTKVQSTNKRGQSSRTKEQEKAAVNFLMAKQNYENTAENRFKTDIVIDETLVNHIRVGHTQGSKAAIDIVYCSDHRGFTNPEAFDQAIKYIVLRVHPEMGQREIKFKLEVVKVKGLPQPLQAVKAIQYKAVIGRINNYLEQNQVTMCAALEGVWY